MGIEMYLLKNIRKTRGLDGWGVIAAICRGELRVGGVDMPADGGPVLFTFDDEDERALFEQHVESWWQTLPAPPALDLTTLEFASNSPEFVPPLNMKLKQWVMSFVQGYDQEKLNIIE